MIPQRLNLVFSQEDTKKMFMKKRSEKVFLCL